ncbi:hypothetical protein [Actinomadura violacea]|uniref:hypothetical protein n=1 Tax=Actinomadura violacea TaxID=2819934 RepID=UPI0035566BB0
MIDAGRGAVTQFMRAGLSMPSLAGIFVTHLHADHTVDLWRASRGSRSRSRCTGRGRRDGCRTVRRPAPTGSTRTPPSPASRPCCGCRTRRSPTPRTASSPSTWAATRPTMSGSTRSSRPRRPERARRIPRRAWIRSR